MNFYEYREVALETLRCDIINIILGAVFLAVGATACAIAAIRRRRGVRMLIWWGIFSGIYGLQILGQASTILTVLPRSFMSVALYVKATVTFLLPVSAFLAWRELVLGTLRLLIGLEIFVGSAIAVAGVGALALGGSAHEWVFCKNLLAVLGLPTLLAVVLVPRLSKLHVIPNYRLLAAVLVIFALVVLYTNLGTLLHYHVLPLVDSLGFAALLFSLGYIALQILFANERRLLSIETELETARQIQSSILPPTVPEVENFRIAASYQPMTAVAGDFYEFIRSDRRHLGILVADVSGHGVPAALISSMIKVAMKSVAVHADDPAQVLGGLNRILWSEAHGQFVSAAYVWIDTDNRTAVYSAAGHPPLLWWHHTRGEMQHIESNGLLFGVESDSAYPVCNLLLQPYDRVLLYTDGVTETENAAGEAFGDHELERVVRNHQAEPASELSRQLLSELQRWRPVAVNQQDDMTLIVVEVR